MFTNTEAFSGFSVDDLEAAKKFYGETLGIRTRPAHPRSAPARRTRPAPTGPRQTARRNRLPSRAYRVLYRVCYSLW